MAKPKPFLPLARFRRSPRRSHGQDRSGGTATNALLPAPVRSGLYVDVENLSDARAPCAVCH